MTALQSKVCEESNKQHSEKITQNSTHRKLSLLFGSETWTKAKNRQKMKDQQIKLLRPLIGEDRLQDDGINLLTPESFF